MTKELIEKTLLMSNVAEANGLTRSSITLKATVETIRAHELQKSLGQVNLGECAKENPENLKI